MRYIKGMLFLSAFLSMSLTLLLFSGCDSGEKAVDGITGNQSVKQYQKMEKDIDNIVDRQNERLDRISGSEETTDEDQDLEDDEW